MSELEKSRSWADANPFCLVIRRDDTREATMIDLGESGWVARHASWMRAPGRWFLVRKGDPQPILAVTVEEGEQPYYTARHTGVAGGGGNSEIVAYGIGKKRLDGQVDRLWVLPNGTICGGDDVSSLALDMLHSMGPRT